jgi:predicted nucleic acid-binding protein
MTPLYIETSAILTWLLGEPAAKIVREAIDGHETVVSSALSIVETERALIRAESTGMITASERYKIKGLFSGTYSDWFLMEITPSVRKRASEAFPIEPLRTLDAIHLATALELMQLYEDLDVLSFDARIRNNLVPLGIHAV